MNSNYENASQALAEDAAGRGSYLDPQTRALTVAQTEATLALAYEQRTANLIAYQGSKEAPYMIDLDAAALNKVIIERLGLA